MYEGTVVFYNKGRLFGFIKPDDSDRKIFFHYSNGSLGRSARHVVVPDPTIGDRVRYNVNRLGETRAIVWSFCDIKERLDTLSPSQRELVRQVLGDKEAKEWEIWDASEELAEDRRYEGREWFGAQLNGSGPRGTFYQVLLWSRYWLAEHDVAGPPLLRWPDMPRYTVRIKAGGQWRVINTPWYTRIQAEVFEQHLLAEGRYDGVRVVDLWSDSPPLTVDEVAKVLAECRRDVLKDDYAGDSEVSWIDNSWDAHTEVATARFSEANTWLTMNGHTYRGAEARQLQFCGPSVHAVLH